MLKIEVFADLNIGDIFHCVYDEPFQDGKKVFAPFMEYTPVLEKISETEYSGTGEYINDSRKKKQGKPIPRIKGTLYGKTKIVRW